MLCGFVFVLSVGMVRERFLSVLSRILWFGPWIFAQGSVEEFFFCSCCDTELSPYIINFPIHSTPCFCNCKCYPVPFCSNAVPLHFSSDPVKLVSRFHNINYL